MALLQRRRVAWILILLLGVVLIWALRPYASGLLAAPVLYILWLPVQTRLTRYMPAPAAAGIILFLTFVVIVVPGFWLVTLLVDQAQGAAQGILESPLLARLEAVRFGRVEVGPLIGQAGQSILSWVGSNAFSMLGTAARFVLSLVFTFFGLYFLLVHPGTAWKAVAPYIPFSPDRARRLGDRFKAVTYSTVIGTGLNAVVQGTLMGLGLMAVGLPNALFWGAITVVLSILPLVGSGLVWVPAAVTLFLTDRIGAGIVLLVWGAVVVANVDNVLRPYVYRIFANIHPMITLVGAIVGVEYFGLVGLVLGPLAIQYFFELIRMFDEEYGEPRAVPEIIPAPDQAEPPAPGASAA